MTCSIQRLRRPLARLLLLAALTSGVGVGTHGDSDAAPVVRKAGAAASRSQAQIRPLRNAVELHPYAGRVARRVLEDRDRTIDSVGQVTDQRLADRAVWVPLGADPDVRKLTVATIMRKFRQRSAGLAKLIDADPKNAAWDVLFVGAGVHTTIAAGTLAQQKVPRSMLTIEASDEVGGNFRDVGSTIARNSANRAQRRSLKSSDRPRRGFGDKNPSRGPWGDPDLDGNEWPELGILADTATVNLFASGSDLLLNERVDRIESRADVRGSSAWPAENRVTLSSGRVVYANAVVRATGIGKPVLPVQDPATVAAFDAEQAKIDFDKPDVVPTQLFYTTALKLANLSKHGRDAYRALTPVKGKKGERGRQSIAVIGGQDGGRTFLEYLYGQAPDDAYSGNGKVDTAQRGEIGDVEWYVGENGPKDCAAFLDTTRSRYLRLAGKIRDAGDGTAPRASLNPVRVTSARLRSDGRYDITDSRGGVKVVDRVIWATGFKATIDEDGPVEEVRGNLRGLDGRRTLAKRVVGRSIYRIGPAAGTDLIGADELFATKENAGSLYAFEPRDRKFTRKVLAETPMVADGLDVASLDARAPLKLAPGSSRASIKLPRKVGVFETPLVDLLLRAELIDALEGIAGDDRQKDLSFEINRAGDALGLASSNHAGADGLASRIAASPLLVEVLRQATEQGRTVLVTVPIGGTGGALQVDGLRIAL